MTLLQNPQLNDDDLELLSAYIDNQLVAGERGALEERLRREPGLRTALEELRGTVAVLRELEPLRPPRSFTLDPAVFAPRPSRLFGWMRLGATLASVLLALTFAIDFVGRGGSPTSAPAAAAPTQFSGGTAAERSALTQATAAPAAPSGAGVAAPTAAPAPMAAAEAQPTAAPAAPAPAAAAEPMPTAAPEATAAPAAEPTAAPAPTAALLIAPAEAPTPYAAQNSDTTITAPSAMDAAAPTAAPAGQLAPPPTQEQGAPLSYAPSDTGTKAAPAEPAGGQAPPAQHAPQPAIRPLRLIQIGLGALVLVLGLGALWVRRRGR